MNEETEPAAALPEDTLPSSPAAPEVAAGPQIWPAAHPAVLLGSDVVVRTYSAGVHVGTLVHRDGREAVLTDARRVWRWRGANTLHELALRGASLDEFTRISEPVAQILLTEAIEIIPATPEAAANLRISRWL